MFCHCSPPSFCILQLRCINRKTLYLCSSNNKKDVCCYCFVCFSDHVAIRPMQWRGYRFKEIADSWPSPTFTNNQPFIDVVGRIYCNESSWVNNDNSFCEKKSFQSAKIQPKSTGAVDVQKWLLSCSGLYIFGQTSSMIGSWTAQIRRRNWVILTNRCW